MKYLFVVSTKNSIISIIRHLLYGIVLSLSSFSGVMYFYVLVRQDFPLVSRDYFGIHDDAFLLRNVLYIFFFSSFAYITLRVTPYIYPNTETLDIKEEKPIESVAVPTYIGLFVIAIGLQPLTQGVGLIVLAIMFLFWRRLEKIFYFNPIWLFFGYRFYEVKSSKNNTYTLITKRSKLKGSYKLSNLRRLNDYTYLETQ